MYDAMYRLTYNATPIAIYTNKNGEDTHLHWHYEIEIIYVEKGKLRATVGDEHFTAEAGDFILVNPTEIHSYAVLERPHLHHCVCFDCALISDVNLRNSILKYELSVPHHIPKQGADSLNLLLFFERLYDAVKINQSALYLESCAYVSLIFAELLKKEYFVRRSPENKNESFCKTVVEYIDGNYRKALSSKELADKLHYSHSYFCRAFSKNFGRSFSVYVNTFRIWKAKELLRDKGIKIIDVSKKCGFSSPEYFSKSFRSVTGMSPTAYKNKYHI